MKLLNNKTMSTDTLSNYVSYETSSMVFLKAKQADIPAAPGKPAIRTFRIAIRTRNEDGSIGALVFSPQHLFTFGVSENKDDKTNAITGFALPLTLYNKDGPTDDQIAFVDTIKNIIEACKRHITEPEIAVSICKPKLKYDSLDGMNKILYYKLDDHGEPVAGRGPSMYPKLYTKRVDSGMEITTEFFDKYGNLLDPNGLIGKFGHTNPAIAIDSIFIGASISIQVRVREAQFDLINSSGRRILPRPRADDTMQTGTTLVASNLHHPDVESMYQDSSDVAVTPETTANTTVVEPIVDDDDEEVVIPQPHPVVEVPKRAPPKKVAVRK